MTNTATRPCAHVTPAGVIVPIVVNGYDDFYAGSARGQSLIVAGRTGNRMKLHTGYLAKDLRAYVDAALARGADHLVIRRREDLKDLRDASENTRDASKGDLVDNDDAQPPEGDGTEPDWEAEAERQLNLSEAGFYGSR